MDLTAFPFATFKYELSHTTQQLSTGCGSIDNLLGGGLCTGEVTEVYGMQGSGKTQLAYSLISNVSRSGCNTAVLIDTDRSFVRERFNELNANVDAVHVLRLSDADEIVACLPVLLPSILRSIDNVRLVVIDSFSFIARNCNYNATMRRLFIFIDRLSHISVAHNIAILVTNDVKAQSPDALTIHEDNEYAIPPASLGAKWATMCPTRIALGKNREDERYAVLVNHPRLLGGRAMFTISTSGVTDYMNHRN